MACDSEDECPISFERFTEAGRRQPRFLPECGHTFSASAIQQLLARLRGAEAPAVLECPLCSTPQPSVRKVSRCKPNWNLIQRLARRKAARARQRATPSELAPPTLRPVATSAPESTQHASRKEARQGEPGEKARRRERAVRPRSGASCAEAAAGATAARAHKRRRRSQETQQAAIPADPVPARAREGAAASSRVQRDVAAQRATAAAEAQARGCAHTATWSCSPLSRVQKSCTPDAHRHHAPQPPHTATNAALCLVHSKTSQAQARFSPAAMARRTLATPRASVSKSAWMRCASLLRQ